MATTNPQLYFDLGENPWTPKQKKIFNTLYILLLLTIPFSIYWKYNTYYELFDFLTPLLYLIISILTVYNFNRGRVAPPGHYFVDLSGGTIKFKSFGDEDVEFFALTDIDYICQEGSKIGFKPKNNQWYYIKAGKKSEEIFTQLQNLIEDLEPKPQIVNLDKNNPI